MNPILRKIFPVAAGLALGATSLTAAPWPPAKGDLVLGVQASGGSGATSNVFLNLGPANLVRDTPSAGAPIANLDAALAAAFGDDWATRDDLHFGVIANRSNAPATGIGSVPPENGDPSRTLYVSKGTGSPGATTPWIASGSSALGVAATNLVGFVEAIDNITGNAAGVMTLNQGANPVEWNNSWSVWNPVPGAAFSIFTGGIQRSFASGGVPQVKMLDLYRIPGDDPDGGGYVTSIYLTEEGDVLLGEDFFTLSTSVDPSESGTVTGDGIYSEGSTAELTAVAADGYAFVNWTGDVNSTDNPLNVTMDANKTLVANFALVPTVTVQPVTGLTGTSATLNGTATSTETVTARGFVYALLADNADPAIGGADVTDLPATVPTGAGAFTAAAITGLPEGTTYAYKGYATTAGGTGYSPVAYFTTDSTLNLVGNIGTIPSGTIQAGDQQNFLFNLTGSQVLNLTGNFPGLVVRLLDGNGNLIATGTPSISGLVLPAGAYRLQVSNPSAGAQNFSAIANAAGVPSAVPVVNATPARITSKNARPVKGRATVGNVGNLPTPVTVSASRSNALFNVTYRGPGGNITAALTKGTYQTATVSGNPAAATITATIKPNKKKLVKKVGKKNRVLKKTFNGRYSVTAPGAAATSRFKVQVR